MRHTLRAAFMRAYWVVEVLAAKKGSRSHASFQDTLPDAHVWAGRRSSKHEAAYDAQLKTASGHLRHALVEWRALRAMSAHVAEAGE